MSPPGTAVVSAAASPIVSLLGGASSLPPSAHPLGMYPTAANILLQIHAYHGGGGAKRWKDIPRLARTLRVSVMIGTLGRPQQVGLPHHLTPWYSQGVLPGMHTNAEE